MFRIISMAIGYAIGCIQTAYFVSKVFHTDLRKRGSGNLGTTNALRVLGRRAGVVTFAGDILKSVLAFVISYLIFRDFTAGIYGSVGAVLGHDFPFYLKFQGGKGIAATIGLMLALGAVHPLLPLIPYIFGIIAVALTRYISAGSLVFAGMIPITMLILHEPTEWVIVTAFLTALAFWRHHANIGRLLSGTENKFAFRKTEGE